MSIIRIAGERDCEQISHIYAPIVHNTVISFEEEAPSAAVMEQRIQSTLPTHPWLVAERDGEIMGYAYASAHHSRAAYRWAADVSVYIGNNYRRRGIGRALYAALFRLLEIQGFYNVYAGIALPNPGSMGLHEALGFTPVGVYRRVGFKHGRWIDVGWWELALREASLPNSSPLPFCDLCHSDRCGQALQAGTEILRLYSA